MIPARAIREARVLCNRIIPLCTRIIALCTCIIAPAGCRPDRAAAPAPDGGASAAERGAIIFRRGVTFAGAPIQAELGEGGLVAPAATVPCAGCHGEDGRGRPEGGVVPSNVRWLALTRPYPLVEGSGRRHPPYDERTLSRAIAMGVDPAGQRLLPAMPRFRLTRADMDDLIAYLKTLDDATDPGVAPDAVRVGTLIADGPDRDRSLAARAALAACLEAASSGGGIYGRRVELRSLVLPGAGPARAAAARTFLDGEQPFALIGVAPLDEDLAALLADRGLLLLHASPAPARAPEGGPIFRMHADLAGRASALASFAGGRHPGARTAVLHDADAASREAARAATARAAAAGLGETIAIEYAGAAQAGALAGRLRDDRIEVVLLLDGTDAAAFLAAAAAAAAARTPRFRPLLLATAATPDLFTAPPSLEGRLHVALPALPTDRTAEALAAYARLAASFGLSERERPAQLDALAACRVLVEGLRRAGRDLSRERLRAALESLRDYETGLGPPITFGPARRTGAAGAWVASVRIRTKTLAPAGWFSAF